LTQEKLPPGSTVVSVILASDKTKLSVFSGDKSAWPVYLGIGNIAKSTQKQPSLQATSLLGYIPVAKLTCFTKTLQIEKGQEHFEFCPSCLHHQSQLVLTTDGVDIICANSSICHAYPILAAYIADFPEQCLVICTRENWCLHCTCEPDQYGEPLDSIFENEDNISFRNPTRHMKVATYLWNTQGDKGRGKGIDNEGI
jgi:hypothetical protein